MTVSRWLSVASVLAFSAHARAAEPVRLRYEAPEGCPNEAVFVERVRERTTHIELAAPGELAQSVGVSLSVDAGGAVGRVSFVDADGVGVSRTVQGDTCDEVVSSLALVTALAIDAAPSEGVKEPPPPEPPHGVAPVPVHPSSAAPAASAPRRDETAKPSAKAGFGVGFAGWAGPQGGLSLDAFFAWSFRPTGPLLRLSAWHWRASGESGGREAVFRGWGGRLEGCPWTLAREEFFAEPCLGTNLGLFRAEGVESPFVSHAEASNLFWRDVLLVGRLGVRVGRLVVVEAQGELAFPLFRHEFGFNDANGDPAGAVFEIPAVSGGAELHVGVRFP